MVEKWFVKILVYCHVKGKKCFQFYSDIFSGFYYLAIIFTCWSAFGCSRL